MRPRRAGFLAALAWTFLSLRAGASTPFVVSESAGSCVLSWPAEADAARLAVPAGRRAVVASIADADGRRLEPTSFTVVPGRFRRLDTVTLVAEPLSGRAPFLVSLRLDASAEAVPQAVDPRDLPRELALLSSAGLVNPGTARDILREQARTPARTARAKALGSARVKLSIDEDGVRRVTFEQLLAAGADMSGIRIDELRVMSRGRAPASREIALRTLDGNGDGLFGPGDWLELFGEALVGEEVSGYFQRADFTDVNAYFLDAAPGVRLRMRETDATPVVSSPAPRAFLSTAHWERDDVFIANHRTGLADVDHFWSCPTLDVVSMPTRTESVPLPGLDASASLPASVRAELLARTGGAASPDHLSEISLNGTLVSTRTADGPTIVAHAASGLAASLLTDPASVEVRLPGLGAGDMARAELNWIEIDYPRSFAAVAGALDFRQAAPARVTVTGVAPDAEGWDVTDPAQPSHLTGLVRGAGTLELEVAGSGTRRIVVATPGAGPTPRIQKIADTGLGDASNEADLLIVGPAAWLSPPLPGLQRYIDWRGAQGVRVKLASFEAACDELNDGLFSPAAVGRLVSSAVSSWASPPAWVLLLGDANVDYKDALGGRILSPSDCSPQPDACGHAEAAWTQAVPTHVIDVPEDQQYLGYFASDSLFAVASGGDWMPDVALGRLPARSAAGIEAMLDKIVAYERLGDAPPAWATRFLTVADEVEPGQETIETSQDAAAARVAACYARETLYFQRDWGASDPEGFTAELLGTWADPARGGAVASYVGHGNTFAWSGQALLTNAGAACRNDVAALSVPGAPEPILLNADCVAGGFMHLAAPSLLEELVRAPQGGAIAAIGPTGVTDLAFASPIVSAFYDALYGPHGRGERLGDVLLAVQAAMALAADSGSPHELETNALLGDPSLRLIVPFGPPAGDLRATAQDGGISLDWDSVPGATAYRLYRSESGPDGPWTIAADALVATSWLDAGLVNAREYHWAVEPLDGCLPGRWSATVSAIPCDTTQAPDPPTGLSLLSGDCDGDALLSWTASPTPGVTGHVLVARRAGALETERETIVPGTFGTLTGLVPFRDYDVTVAGIDGCGVRGEPSAALRVRLTCPLSIDPPAFIRDLRVRRQGSDVLLSWGAVTTTTQGAPFTPAAYRVHRASTPDFVAATAIVDRVVATSATQGSRVGNGALEFYAVAALDGSDRPGPVGHDLPQGIRGLSRATVGTDYALTWSPVTHDVDGERTAVASYEVHASTSPLTRAAADARAPDAVVTAPAATLPQALGAYHLVIAVDVHGNRSAW